MTRREFLRHAAALGGAAMLYPSVLWSGEGDGGRPNVVFILTDDQRIRDFGCYGGSKAITPNVDALAAGGVRFTRAMVTCPVCAPSRVSLLTGRYLSRFRASPANEGASFPATQPTVASILKAAGYQTGFIGKAHFGITGLTGVKELDARLKAVGFTFVENAHPYNDKRGIHLERQEKAFDSAIKFVTRNKDRPFALVLATTLTHGPYEAPQKYQDMVKPHKGSLRDAGATWLDAEVGRLVKAIDDLGIRKRTAIFYAVDNAPAGKKAGDNKRTVYDGFIAQIVNWPGRVRGGQVVDAVTQNIDYLPTILDICGVPVPPAAKADGRSFLPLLAGKPVEWRKVSYLEHGCVRAVRTERWKYIAVRALPKWPEKRDLPHHRGERDQLFDLKADPEEKKNLFGDPAQAAVVREMQGLLRAHCGTYDYAFGEFGGGGGGGR
jgi:arylsulfatase A-like enzyme